MKIYLVGGAVRDELMGLTPKDLDYVVVGSNVDEMLSLGFTKVGADFPVFLHPETGDEYALARTERKSGTGYNGFECEWEGVTLEEDLSRRDLTINSMASTVKLDISTCEILSAIGTIIDPFNGRADIKNKVLRHTSEAFSDDPLRVLRAARFLARFGKEWIIDEDTQVLMFRLFTSGELKHLTPERVWKETEKALSEKTPSLYFMALLRFGLFDEYDKGFYTPQKLEHHPENLVGIHTNMVMDYAAIKGYSPEVVFACLCHDFGKVIAHNKYGNFFGHEKEGLQPINEFCDRFKVPNLYRELALLVCEHHTKIHGVLGRNDQKPTRPKSIMKLFEATAALTKPERFEKILQACESDARGRGITAEGIDLSKQEYKQKEYLLRLLKAAKEVDTKTISSEMLAKGKQGVMIGEDIRVGIINAIRGEMKLWNNQNKS